MVFHCMRDIIKDKENVKKAQKFLGIRNGERAQQANSALGERKNGVRFGEAY